MYMHLQSHEFQPGKADVVLQRVESDLMPIVFGHEGFRSYEVVRTGPDHTLVVSRWDSDEPVAEIRNITARWVETNVGGDIVSLHSAGGPIGSSHPQ